MLTLLLGALLGVIDFFYAADAYNIHLPYIDLFQKSLGTIGLFGVVLVFFIVSKTLNKFVAFVLGLIIYTYAAYVLLSLLLPGYH